MGIKKVRIKITETFEKEVEVNVPRGMMGDDTLIWVREHLDSRILYATNQFGVKDVGSSMDYKRTLEVTNVGDAS